MYFTVINSNYSLSSFPALVFNILLYSVFYGSPRSNPSIISSIFLGSIADDAPLLSLSSILPSIISSIFLRSIVYDAPFLSLSPTTPIYHLRIYLVRISSIFLVALTHLSNAFTSMIQQHGDRLHMILFRPGDW